MVRTLSLAVGTTALALVAAGCASSKGKMPTTAMQPAAKAAPSRTMATPQPAPPAAAQEAVMPTVSTPPATPATVTAPPAPQRSAHLPRTASDRPLLLLVGISALAAAAALHRATGA